MRVSALIAALWTTAGMAGAHPPDENGRHEDEPAAKAEAAADVNIEIKDGYRVITASGVPDHATGQFPGPHNPGKIAAQNFVFRVPLAPRVSEKPIAIGPAGRPPGPGEGQRGRGPGGGGGRGGSGGPPLLFGVALNGVVFDPGTAEWWNDDPSSGWHVEAFGPGTRLGIDANHAHVQPPSGMYHYHGVPTALVERLAGADAGKTMVLVAWAADGFPVYARWGYGEGEDAKSAVKELRSSYRLKAGARPAQEKGPGGAYDGTFEEDYEFVAGLGDLDECNGRTGVTPEFAGGTYYYVITTGYPFVPRKLHGVPDESFRKGPPGGGRGRPGGPRGG